MATQHHDLGRASALPLSAMLEALPSLPRPILSRLVARAIEHMDEMDGDCDQEEDDPTGQCDEDGINTGNPAFAMHGRSYYGPGCLIADGGAL